MVSNETSGNQFNYFSDKFDTENSKSPISKFSLFHDKGKEKVYKYENADFDVAETIEPLNSKIPRGPLNSGVGLVNYSLDVAYPAASGSLDNSKVGSTLSVEIEDKEENEYKLHVILLTFNYMSNDEGVVSYPFLTS
jgi:hypothetical protein